MNERTKRQRKKKRRNILIIRILFLINVLWTAGLIIGIFMKKDNEIIKGSESMKKEEESKLNVDIETGSDTSDNNMFDVFANEYENKLDRCRQFVVCIDAGHGGSDIGAEGKNGESEKEQNLRLSFLVKDYLESAGIKVIMTRCKDEKLSLDERRELAESSNANLLISIHRNVYEGTEDVNGVEAWISKSRPKDAEKFAKDILAGIEGEIEGINNRGVKLGSMDNPNEDYGMNKVSMASLILEAGFISSDLDNELFDNYIDGYAKGIARGILNNV